MMYMKNFLDWPIYVSMLQFLLTLLACALLSPRQASELKPDVETGVEELHATALCNANIFLRSGHACTVKPGVATEFRHEKWQMSPDQMPPCIPCITYMYSTIFLRSGQAYTLPPGVTRESRNDQCQMSPNQMLPVQFTRTCSITSLRYVLFPKHRFHRFRWF